MSHNEFQELLEDTYDASPNTLYDETGREVGRQYFLFAGSDYPASEVFIPSIADGEAFKLPLRGHSIDEEDDIRALDEPDFDDLESFRDYVMDLYMEQFGPETASETPDEEMAREWVASTNRFEFADDGDTIEKV